MAMAKRASMMPTKQEKYKYPSVFGSHKSMVIEEKSDGTVSCEDEFGIYTTTKNRLDDGCADPKRYAQSRIHKLFEGRKEKEDQSANFGKDIVATIEVIV